MIVFYNWIVRYWYWVIHSFVHNNFSINVSNRMYLIFAFKKYLKTLLAICWLTKPKPLIDVSSMIDHILNFLFILLAIDELKVYGYNSQRKYQDFRWYYLLRSNNSFLQIFLQFMYEKEGLTTNTIKCSYIPEHTIQ